MEKIMSDVMEKTETREAAINVDGAEVVEVAVTLLCNDLWEEILFRLHCRALYRAKCVSKGWNNLISSAISDGRRQPLMMPRGIFVNHCDSPRKLRNWEYYSSSTEKEDRGGLSTLGFLPFNNEEAFRVENACNGLILLSNISNKVPPRKTESEAKVPVNFYVCNPLTKKWIEICKREEAEPSRASAALAFDHDPPPNYISGQYHFKIIFFRFEYRDKLKIAVFSSKTGQWVDKSPDYVDALSTPPRIIRFDPTIHWYYVNGVVYKLHYEKHIVLCYHVEGNRFSSIKLPDLKPDIINGGWLSSVLGSMDGCLNFTTVYCKRAKHKLIRIWKLDCSTGKWVLMHEIPTDDILPKLPDSQSYVCPVIDLNSLEILIMWPADRDGMNVFTYNIIDKRTRNVCSITHLRAYSTLQWLFPISPQPLPLPRAARARACV